MTFLFLGLKVSFFFSVGFQNLMFKSVLQCSSYFVGIYLFFGLKVHFFRGVGGINFCSLPYTVPSGSSE